MSDSSIFTRQNQTLVDLFNEAGHPDKVLCVALDYAKKTHVALFCNGSGKVLRKAFPVDNTAEGLEFMMAAVEKICKKHHLQREHVFFGGEDCGTFALNFIYALRDRGFVVIGVHAKDAAKQRENMQASTDDLDLLGIAKMLVNRRGSIAGGTMGIERSMRSLTRHRKQRVRMQTATKNRINKLVDQIFPGFLDEKLSGIVAFTESSLFLMEDRFSPKQIAARREKTLLKQFKALGMQHAEQAIARLKTLARNVLVCPPELIGMLQSSLSSEIRLYRCLNDNIKQLEREIAQQLAKAPGAMLTTIRGVGLTLAAGAAAEIGSMASQQSVGRLTSYAGIVPRVKQTGGPGKEAKTGKVSRRCNHILKDFVVQCGSHMGQHGPAALSEDHRRRGASGQHADFGIARRFLRIGMCLMRSNDGYVPPELREGATPEQLRAYYLQLWPKLLHKWNKLGAAHTAFDARNPLGQWRERIEAIYEIKLPLPKKK